MDRLPSYDELPVVEGAPSGSSWGLWGEGDRLGCLNLIDEAATRRGVASARRGSVFNLNLELELPDPPSFGRSAYRREVLPLGPFASDDLIDGFNTQRSSQWDGFRHVRSPFHGAYGGIDPEEHGIHFWAQRGIATRGVLADVARWRESEGRPIDPKVGIITPDELADTLAAQGSEVEPGDILLIRTGWLDWYRTLDASGRGAFAESTGASCGLAQGEDTARLLWDLHIAAVATDNPAVEAWPLPHERGGEAVDESRLGEAAVAAATFLHFSLLPLLGLPLGELFDLGPLAESCAADGEWDFLFTSAPLNLAFGVASPPNALAIR